MDFDYDTKIRRLVSQARTLPHLPPNTFLKTDQAEDEQLLNEWLARSDLDPIQWLMNDHSDLCVKLLLWKHLDNLRAGLISKQRDIAIKKMGMIGNAHQQSLNIGYTFNKHDLALLRPLAYTHPLTVEKERLLQVFSRLRRREMAVASNDRLNAYEWDLRNKLLLLPDDVHPLIWLRENYLQYAAASTLQYLIKQIIPRNISLLSSSYYTSRYESFSPKTVCRSKGIRLVLEKITYIHDIFSIRLAFTITGSHLKALEKTRISARHGYVEWRGAGNLSDNLGNRYLICHSLLNRSSADFSKPEHIYDYDFRLDCYPGIMRKAKQLVLSYDDVTLIAEEISAGAADNIYYSVSLGKLKWTIDLRPLRRRYVPFFP